MIAMCKNTRVHTVDGQCEGPEVGAHTVHCFHLHAVVLGSPVHVGNMILPGQQRSVIRTLWTATINNLWTIWTKHFYEYQP